MDIRKDPLALVLIIAIFTTTFYLFAPRVFRFFCVGIGLSWWQSEPVASVKTTIDVCTRFYYRLEYSGYACKKNAGVLTCQIVVYAVAVMCVLKEVEYIVGSWEGRKTKA